MPATIRRPDPDSKIARMDDIIAYGLDIKEDTPLYRGIKLIADRPFFGTRRTAFLYWIVHLQRFRRGGDAWRILQEAPEVMQWLTEECAALYDKQYVLDTFGIDDAEYAALAGQEREKYGDETPAAKTLADLM